MRKILLALPLIITAFAAQAETQPPVPPTPPANVTITPVAKPLDSAKVELTPAQKAKVAERAAFIQKQLNDLSPVEQQAVMKAVRPARPQLTDAQRKQMGEERFAKTEANWLSKSAEDKAELREKAQANWIKLPANQKAYQRDKMVEKLKALPAEDRQQIISAVQQ